MHALAATLGIACEHSKRDVNGWDVHLYANDTPQADALQLNVQLKCTVNRLHLASGGSHRSFPLPAHNYNHLRKSPVHPPRILVVVEAGNARPEAWLDVTREQLLLKTKAWWLSLEGRPPLSSPTQQSTTVHIPNAQRLTPRSLLANMRSVPIGPALPPAAAPATIQGGNGP